MDDPNANRHPDPGPENSNEEAERIESQANTNAASRAIAVMILMVIPGVIGGYLDKWLGTQFLILVGFAIGIAIAIYGLLYVAKIADLAAKKSRDMRKAAKDSSAAKETESRNG